MWKTPALRYRRMKILPNAVVSRGLLADLTGTKEQFRRGILRFVGESAREHAPKSYARFQRSPLRNPKKHKEEIP